LNHEKVEVKICFQSFQFRLICCVQSGILPAKLRRRFPACHLESLLSGELVHTLPSALMITAGPLLAWPPAGSLRQKLCAWAPKPAFDANPCHRPYVLFTFAVAALKLRLAQDAGTGGHFNSISFRHGRNGKTLHSR
jgi:hypothetical protein